MMMHTLYALTAFVAALIPNAIAVASTDSYSDADIGQSGYLPNHNMDPAVVDSSEFGLLWKQTFNAQEQVSFIIVFSATFTDSGQCHWGP